MFRWLSVFLVLSLFAMLPASLPAQDKLVVFGGYSYLRPPVTVTETCPICATPGVFDFTSHQNLNGWELSATYRFLPFLGFAADFSGHYGPSTSGYSSNVHQHTVLFGPEVSLPARVSPFAHVLFGVTHQSISGANPNAIPVGAPSYLSVLAATNTDFATAFGAGIDLRLIPHVWIRPIQIDYLVTRLNNNTQSQPRVSAGVVLHF